MTDEELLKMKSVSPARFRVTRHFEYAHLPEHLQGASKPFCDLAKQLDAILPDSTESIFCLMKLLEAKDMAVRAVVP